MQEFNTQLTLSEKSEIEKDGVVQYTLTMLPEGGIVSGYLIITTPESENSTFFDTGVTYDVVITPRPASS